MVQVHTQPGPSEDTIMVQVHTQPGPSEDTIMVQVHTQPRNNEYTIMVQVHIQPGPYTTRSIHKQATVRIQRHTALYIYSCLFIL